MIVLTLVAMACGLTSAGPVEMRDEPLTQADFDLALSTDYSQDETHDEDGSPDLFEGDIELTADDRAILETRGMLGLREVVKTAKWEKDSDGLVRIPYKVPSNLSGSKRAMIAKTVLEYQRKTCIRFVPYKNEQKHYIKINTQADKCSSPLGRKPYFNEVKFGPRCSWGNLAHEFMHSLGFYHEHTRTDRDNFITINWDAIPSDWEHNFYKCDQRYGGCNDLDVGYDYNSIMHYGPRLNGATQDSIIPKRGGVRIGQRSQLSALDIEGIKEYYACGPNTSDGSAVGGNCPRDQNPNCKSFKEEGWCSPNASPEHKSFMKALCQTSCCGLLL